MDTMKFLKAVLAAIVVLVIVGLLMGFPIMWIWNYIISDIFHVRAITFFEALALYFFCQAMFTRTSSSEK